MAAAVAEMGVSMFFHYIFRLKLTPDLVHLHTFRTLMISTKTRFIRSVSMATLFWNRLLCCHRWILSIYFAPPPQEQIV